MPRRFTHALARAISRRSSRSEETKGDGSSAVEMIGVTVLRRRLPALCEVNLKIEKGEVLAITGPNGAGKTTLLNCLSGDIRRNRGKVRWFGGFTTRSPMVRRQIGYAGHECSLYRELTALENLMFAGRMYSIEHPVERAKELLETAGLQRNADHRAGNLSQGVRRRLAIARALVHEPALILVDEPFASLDVAGQRWLDELFRKWRNGGRTVCFTSHDIDQCRQLADRIVWLDRGHIVRVEVTDPLLAAARWSA